MKKITNEWRCYLIQEAKEYEKLAELPEEKEIEMAKNPDLPRDVMNLLAKEGGKKVKKELLMNPNLSKKAMRIMARSAKSFLRSDKLMRLMSLRDDVPGNLLKKIYSATAEPRIKRNIAENPNTPTSFLRRIVTSQIVDSVASGKNDRVLGPAWKNLQSKKDDS